jgi:hypothetical protein
MTTFAEGLLGIQCAGLVSAPCFEFGCCSVYRADEFRYTEDTGFLHICDDFGEFVAGCEEWIPIAE